MVDIKPNIIPQGVLDLAVYLKGLILRFPFAKSKRDDIFWVRLLIIKYISKLVPAQRKLFEVIKLQEIADM
jgi:hypothetical protein